MDETAKNKMVKARTALILDKPFFGNLAIRLQLIESYERETMSTNGKDIFYNPDFVKELRPDELKGVIAHEIFHIILCHHIRRNDRDVARWNIAADYAINDILLNDGFTLPKGVLSGMGTELTAEKIYPVIPPQTGDDDGQGCGAIEDLKNKDGKELSPSEVRQETNRVKVMVSQAKRQATTADAISDGVERLAQKILNPKIDWRDILRRFVDDTAKNDYAWFPPNRRYIHQGLYLPSAYSNELGNIVFAVDTSGSVDDDLVAEFSAEMSGIMEQFNCKATVIYCDYAVRDVEYFAPDNLPIKFKTTGGGGTSFKPPFEWVKEKGIVPTCLIYLTDLESTRFPDCPDYPVLWAYWGHFGETPPFGETIVID